MILLVVGLVAVVVVVLIAVVLSIRLGRGDDHDEPDMGSRSRDQRRGQDERRRERDGRPAPSSASTTAGRGGRDPGYGSHGPARERDSRNRAYDGARRPSHPQPPGSRRPAAARSAVGASARGRYDGGPSRRPAADDYPSSDYPSMDFAPGGRYPSGDHPSAEFPAADYDAMDDPRGGRESRRKPASAPAGGKTKSRQRGKRDDDSDWPSTEWDKLSDEQYWAELSADKPLSSMARPAKAPANGAAKASGSQAKPAARETRAARSPAPENDLPSRTEPGRSEARRTERGEQREPVTQHLPVRGGAHQAARAPQPRREADPAAGRSYPEPRSVLDTGPRPVRGTGPHAARESVPQPRVGHRRRDATGPRPARDRDQELAMLAGPASAPPPIPGALQDDPLTSPSFSLKAAPASDSRSYSNARKHAKTTGQPGAAQANGNRGGSNPAGDYADPGYAYHAAPPAPVPPQAPLYGNPYQQAGSGNGSAARYPDGQATEGYASYHTDPLRTYAPPGSQAPAPYADPASPSGYQLPSAGTVPYAESYQQYPYPDQAGYQDGGGVSGYTHGYDGGYTGDPYPSGGYRPYPPQG